MTHEHPAAGDWATARGEIWRAQLDPMEAMLAPTDEPLIRALRLDAPLRIADVACGGGATSQEILRRAPGGSVVHGFDIAPALVEIARGRHPEVVFSTADVATTRPDAPYDRLASRFGVMFFDDPPAAFSNLAGWLAPGGRFAFAVWGPPDQNPMGTLRDVVAELIDLPPPDPEAPGPFRYADVGILVDLLQQTGFADVTATEWHGTLPMGGGLPPAAAAEFATTALSVAQHLAEATPEIREKARRALTERYSAQVHDGIVRVEASLWVVSGTVLRSSLVS